MNAHSLLDDSHVGFKKNIKYPVAASLEITEIF